MTAKDWLLLLVPIVSNLLIDGIIVILLQKFVIDKYIKRRLLKDEIVKSFLEKLKGINQHLIELNFESMRGNLVDVKSIQDKVVDLCEYFHPNVYDLKKFEKKFNKMNEYWMNFQTAYTSYIGKTLTDNMRKDLGEKMQKFYDSVSMLNKYVRKHY